MLSRFIVFLLLIVVVFHFARGQENNSPNILWLVIEDTSPQNIACYGNTAVHTPNIDKLAKEGVSFSNAYSTGTSCAPSRSTIITGVRTFKMGTGNQRSQFPIPDYIKGFPSCLKQAGYYTTNNSKTDYNTSSESYIIQNSWNENSNSAGWWNRRPGQPFFAVFNIYDSHQSRTMSNSFEDYQNQVLQYLPDSLQVDDEEFEMPPYLNDSPEMRKQYARMYNAISLADYNLGKVLTRLENEGLKDSTIIFFYADHGQGMPRVKTNGIGQGYKVPFVIWFPEMYKHLSPWNTSGTVTSEQINFADLAPTILSLAGVHIPDYFDGRAFLGSAREEADEYVFVSNDRCDNSFNLDRGVIKDSLIYVRHFTPFSPEQRWISYFINGEICQIMFEDFVQGNLPDEQSFVFEKRTPEGLYNLYLDKWEMNNLIDDPDYTKELSEMRQVMEKNILESKDVLFANEYDLKRLSADITPYEFRLSEEYNINEIWEAVSISGFNTDESKQKQIELLGHPNKLVRFWAAVGLKSQDGLKDADIEEISNHLNDSYAPVQIYLSSVLYDYNKNEEAKSIIKNYSLSSDPDLSLMALHNLQNMKNNMDFAVFLSQVISHAQNSNDLWNTKASAEVLLYRLNGIMFGFEDAVSTIPETDLVNFEIPVNVSTSHGASFEIVDNSSRLGINGTEHCGQIKRTTTNWYELLDIPCNFSIPPGEVGYLHVLIKYPGQPDIIVRPNMMGNEINLRPLNEFKSISDWQDLVFEIPGGFEGLEVSNLRFMGDCGFQNEPKGFVLDDSSGFGHIDEIIINNSPTPRTVVTAIGEKQEKKEYSLGTINQKINYRNLSAHNNPINIFDIKGNLLYSANVDHVEFRVPKTGVYIVRIGNDIEKIVVM